MNKKNNGRSTRITLRPQARGSGLSGLRETWKKLRPGIEKALAEFKRKGGSLNDREIFPELVFCLFTPQSKARSCWAAVETLKEKKLLFAENADRLSCELNSVRFKNNKARYVVCARDQFLSGPGKSLVAKLRSFSSSREAREWLVKNVKGLGYKEASHFLRNIGRGEEIAILDRHILKNLVRCGVIPEVPASLTPKIYHEIENKMEHFARKIGIPLSHLDLLFWCRETGEIFK